VYRSYLVRTDLIGKLEPYAKNSWMEIKKSGQKIPEGRTMYILFKKCWKCEIVVCDQQKHIVMCLFNEDQGKK
jgi:hypothetical protein